jgi:asparagine synthase (glutamine-hydrolysing)
MNNLAHHRGPDGEGYFFGTDIALGHRRLAITDLSGLASQPMIIDGYAIIFNGEIYNFQTIKKELQLLHHVTFVSESDTEVLLQAYKQWGDQCVQKLDGMWSFILFDPSKNILFCSRDHVGIKPFYYMVCEQKLYIASEIKQLMPFYKNRLANTEAVVDYLLFGLEDHLEETFFKGIFRLLPGHNLVYDLSNHTFSILGYSVIHLAEISTERDFSNLVRDKITKSVQLRENAMVRIGTTISGGLDSAVIGACLTNKNATFAIHAKSVEITQDESSYAEEVANHLKLNLQCFTPHIEHWKKELDEIIKVQEEPFGGLSVVMQYKLFEQVKKEGIKVLLDGQGADEIFLGYRPYFYKALKKYNILQKYKIWQEQKLFISHNIFKSILYYAHIHFKSIINLRLNIQKKFIAKSLYKFIMPKKLYKKYGLAMSFGELQVNEITKYQLPALLKYEDKNAMSQSIETRLPYLDQSLIQMAISMPLDQKINRGTTKFVLRKAFSNLLPATYYMEKG